MTDFDDRPLLSFRKDSEHSTAAPSPCGAGLSPAGSPLSRSDARGAWPPGSCADFFARDRAAETRCPLIARCVQSIISNNVIVYLLFS